MISHKKIIAIIPAYNEAKTIHNVVLGLLPQVDEVIVVDDASNDGTGECAQRAGAVVVTHERHKGYDTTINDGFAEAHNRGADIMFTFDADGEHDVGDVSALLAPILEGRADLVLGQRSGNRHWGETVFASYTRMRYGVSDPLCGMKAYTRAVYDRVGFFDSLSSIGSELFLRAIKHGYHHELVHIKLHIREKGDTSRFYAMNFRGNIKILKALWRILWL